MFNDTICSADVAQLQMIFGTVACHDAHITCRYEIERHIA